MIVSVSIGEHAEFPESCPFQHHVHTGTICAHPVMETSTTHLYCNYWYSVAKYVDSPTRCPLVKNPVRNVKIEAVLK